MTKKPNRVYYLERLSAEREALLNATCEAARKAHQALADEYAQRLAQCPDVEPQVIALPVKSSL